MARSLQTFNPRKYKQVKEEAIYTIQRKIQKIKEKNARRNKYNLAEYGE
jgi:hypothetical protein